LNKPNLQVCLKCNRIFYLTGVVEHDDVRHDDESYGVYYGYKEYAEQNPLG